MLPKSRGKSILNFDISAHFYLYNIKLLLMLNLDLVASKLKVVSFFFSKERNGKEPAEEETNFLK